MIEVAITGLRETIGTLREAQRQVPFASSQACNDTAKDVQTWTIRDRLPQAFTLRARGAPWWKPGTRMGFNIKFASKAKPEAVLGSQADWMKLQEEGGTKRRDGRLAIPSTEWKPKQAVMERGKKPKRVLKSKVAYGRKAFVAKPGGKLKPGIYVRTGQERRIQRLFTLTESAHIDPVLHWVRDGLARASAVFEGYFDKRWIAAMRTRL